MGFNRFQLTCIVKAIMMAMCIALSVYFFLDRYFTYSITMGVLSLLILANLIHYVQTVTREMTRFLQSIEFSDLSVSFPERKFGGIFNDYFNSLRNIAENIRQIRADREGHSHYLQTIIRNVATGLISVNKNGEVELINPAAKSILDISSLKHISQLEFYDEWLNMKPGEKQIVQWGEGVDKKLLSLVNSKFTLLGQSFTMVSFHDIQKELENEKMLNELNMAQHVQMSLFPVTPPETQKYDIKGCCIPAMETGGDYYDWFYAGDGSLTLLVGDVSGKGLAAATYMTLAKGMFQTISLTDWSVSKMISLANKMLYETMEKNRFISVFLCSLNPQSNTLKYVRAGHNPPVIYRKVSDTFTYLQGRGLAVGLCDEYDFDRILEEKEVTLNSGDILIMYTDGVTEAMNSEGDVYGVHRLIEAVKQSVGMPSEDIMQAIYRDIGMFTGDTPPHDDITMIVVKTG